MLALLRLLIAVGLAIYGLNYLKSSYDLDQAGNKLYTHRWKRDTNVQIMGFGSIGLALLVLLFRKPKFLGPKEDYIVRYKHLKWKPGEFTRHWLITGDTGVGKTTSGFNPLLHQISVSRPNWGGLILGAKGDEHFFALEHAAGHGRKEAVCVLEVRPELPALEDVYLQLMQKEGRS